jgi:hypothetical protein
MYNFEMTCTGCPEQYDVFDEQGEQVAYIRLRWGTLRVDVPDCGGEDIYSKYYDEPYLGEFPSEEERTEQLAIIEGKIKEYYERKDK